MAKWFYYNESGDKIEVTGGQLKGLAKAGMITPDTIVETEEGKTAPARKVKGLTFLTATQPEMVQPEMSVPESTVPESLPLDDVSFGLPANAEVYGFQPEPPKPIPVVPQHTA